jgi:hypothetical protein
MPCIDIFINYKVVVMMSMEVVYYLLRARRFWLYMGLVGWRRLVSILNNMIFQRGLHIIR